MENPLWYFEEVLIGFCICRKVMSHKKVIFLPFCHQFWIELDWDLPHSKTSWSICNKVLTLKQFHTVPYFHLLPFHAPELVINRCYLLKCGLNASHYLTYIASAHEFINGSLVRLQTLFVLVNKFQFTPVSSFHKFQSSMLCTAYYNCAAFSDLNVAASHYYPFPLLFIAVTLSLVFIAALLLYFIKRMQWDCSVTVVISCR